MSHTHSIIVQLLPSQTGETLTAKVFGDNGVQVGSDLSATFEELGDGDYRFTTTYADEFSGYITFHTSSGYQCSATYHATIATDLSSVIDAIENLGASLAASSVTVISPFEAGSSNLIITRGDDYSTALGNAISWVGDDWPDLSTASIRLSAKNIATGAYDLEEMPVTATQGDDDEQTLTLQLEHASTQSLAVGDAIYRYDIQATIDEEKITLVNGTISVVEDVEDRGEEVS